MMNTLQQTSLLDLQPRPKALINRWFKRCLGAFVGASALAIGLGVSDPAFAMLQMGYSGVGVSNLQSTLASLGHYNGPITGYFGEMTKSAVMSYQVSHGLSPDGVVGDRTLNCLQIDAATPPSNFSAASPPAITTQSTAVAPTSTVGQPVVQPQATTQVAQPQATTQIAQPQVVMSQPVMMVPMMVTQAVPTQTVVAAPSTVTPQSTITTQSTSTVSGVRLGTSGPSVTEVQQLLGTVGYAVPVTGYFGQMTQSAVISFQQANGLVADGVVGPQTLTVLRSGRGGAASSSFQVASASTVSSGSLRMGTSGAQVTQIQQALSRFGYSVPATGYFGEMTQSAVMQFQTARGLTVDGVVGPATLAQLGL